MYCSNKQPDHALRVSIYRGETSASIVGVIKWGEKVVVGLSSGEHEPPQCRLCAGAAGRVVGQAHPAWAPSYHGDVALAAIAVIHNRRPDDAAED